MGHKGLGGSYFWHKKVDGRQTMIMVRYPHSAKAGITVVKSTPLRVTKRDAPLHHLFYMPVNLFARVTAGRVFHKEGKSCPNVCLPGSAGAGKEDSLFQP